MKKILLLLPALCLLLCTACAGSTTEKSPDFSFAGHWECTYVTSQGLTLPSDKVDMEYSLDVYADGMAIFDLNTAETKCTWEEAEKGYTIRCFDTDFPIEVKGSHIVWNFNGYYMKFEKTDTESDADFESATDAIGQMEANQAAEEADRQGPLYETAAPETPESGTVSATQAGYDRIQGMGPEKYGLTYADICEILGCHGEYRAEDSAADTAVYRWADETGSQGILITFRDDGSGVYYLEKIAHNLDTEENS